MLPVSADFTNQVMGNYRKIHGKVIVDYEGPYTTSTFTVSSDDADPLFDVNQTADGIEETDYPVAVLDGTWKLGTDHLYSPYIQAGWWTASVCDDTGLFSTPYPKLTVQMEDRTITELHVVGDSSKGEYPVEFIITLYDFDGNVLHTEHITDNNAVKWSKSITVNGIYTATLEIVKWSQPHTRAKIAEFMSPIYETYGDELIMDLTLTEEREMSGITLPVGNISMNELRVRLYNDGRFDLDNTSSILYGRLKPNCRVRAYIGVELTDGSTEWLPLGTFWTTDWKVDENNLTAEFRARDRLQQLASSHYNAGLLENMTLYDIAKDILEDAGLTFRDYRIDDALKDTTIPYVYFTSMSHMAALKLVAGAGLAVVYTDRYGIITIEKIDLTAGDSVLTIDGNYYFEKKTPLMYGKVYTRVRVRTQPLVLGDTTEVYRSVEPVHVPAGGETSTTIFYTYQPVKDATVSLEGATNTVIDSTIFYSWGALVKLKNNGGTDEDVVIVVNAKPLQVQGAELITKEDAKAIVDYGLIVYTLPNNPLIQDRATARKIAEELLASYKDPQRAVILSWIGNPAVELGDKITIDGTDYYVIKQVLKYDGGLTATTETRKA